jgi:hypothetical protein
LSSGRKLIAVNVVAGGYAMEKPEHPSYFMLGILL